jgi:hypothetical protein
MVSDSRSDGAPGAYEHMLYCILHVRIERLSQREVDRKDAIIQMVDKNLDDVHNL